MANYSDIRGYRVKYLSSDPTLNASTEGQVWYNSTEGTLKSLVQIKAFSSTANLPQGIRNAAGSGTPTAAFNAGGHDPSTVTNVTYNYNGYSWASSGNMNTTRFVLAGAGTQTTGLAFGGTSPTTGATESYNGSSWTTVNPLNTARYELMGTGTQTAALAAGGINASPTDNTATEEYDGTSWASSNPLNTGRWDIVGTGIQTAGLATAGKTPPAGGLTDVEEYDGTSWTAVNSQTGDSNWGGCGGGTVNHTTVFGGEEYIATGQEYDGTNWSSLPASMSTARRYGQVGNIGTAKGSFFAGGYNGSNTAATEEYISDIANYSPSTTDAWASGGNMSTTRAYIGSWGTKSSAIGAGGLPPGGSPIANTEEYNGSTWSGGGNLNTARRSAGGAGVSEPAGLAFGGFTPAATRTTATESYDGSTWTSTTGLPSATTDSGSAGTQTTALNFGGSPSPSVGTTATNEWNGSAWTAGGNLNTGRYNLTGFGTQTAAIAAIGQTPTPGDDTESYNGTSWTTENNMLANLEGSFSFGIQTSGILTGGQAPYQSAAYDWDGTNWSPTASMSTARQKGGDGGVSNLSGLVFGGEGTVYTNATEEFTGGGPASPTGAVASTLTTS